MRPPLAPRVIEALAIYATVLLSHGMLEFTEGDRQSDLWAAEVEASR